MNILFLSSDYPPRPLGGVGNYTDQFARHLVKRGHRAFVITEADDTPCDYVDAGVRVWRVRAEPIRWLNPGREEFPGLIRRVEYSVAVARTLRRIIRRFPIDAVESCESRAEGFWYYAFHRRPPLIIKLHTPDRIIFRLNQRQPSKDVDLMLTLEEWWLRRATRWVGLTDALTREMGTLYRLKTDDVPRVRVPVETDFFRPDPSRSPDGEFRVIYVGRLEFRKGVHVFLRAIPRILQRIPGVQFDLFGEDSGMRALVEAFQRDPRTQGRLRWHGPVARAQLLEAYQASDVCVVPSLWENHPTVCLEAMSCGCAVVASRVGGIPEIVEHDVSGILVHPGSSYALANAVVKLLKDQRKREALGLQARHRMEQSYDTERVLDDTIQVYEHLLNGRNGHQKKVSGAFLEPR